HESLAARPLKNEVDASRPYAFLVEPERTAAGDVEDVATIFLTNRECPYRCLMCDLWKNTTDTRVPEGAIPRQIDYALSRLPSAKHVKLYNSGNFFDGQAIPRADYAAIAERVKHFNTVIVENHPKLCSDECLRFRDLIETKLEIALGLETIHPQVLPRLNKQMTTADFARAAEFLVRHEIAVRAFILLKPPFLTEQEGIDWSVKSMEFAFSSGARCCAIIPTRAGNGIMEQLQTTGEFAPPKLSSLEEALEQGIGMQQGRVFVDLWDVERFFDCSQCGPKRAERLQRMNLSQEITSRISCHCGDG
ncbi:MAG: radical SAM protein, partial [Planctomycetes bacterium]|nr:radical SAM protein [Planctomycetota bacterium]